MTDVSLKASLVPLTTLSFATSNLSHIREQLHQKQQDAPQLFQNLPCVLDMQGLDGSSLNLDALKQVCTTCGLLPIAIKNADDVWKAQAEALALADLGKGSSKSAPVLQAAPEKPQRHVKLHMTNVRSGQQLYHDGDLFVFGMVSAGAEVLATGDIHIYGALRGRALAGVKGDEAAIISAQQFEAELISVAGQYRVLEEDAPQHKETVVIQLTDGRLNILGLS